ncbi:MAG: hypothetical protein RIT45_320 [Pseudomonadota bacterium]|jgi:uncharacterized membrane protein
MQEQPDPQPAAEAELAPTASAAPATAPKASMLRRGEPLPASIFARLVLILAGLVWLAIGLYAMADPVAVADSVDFELRSDLARLEIRAMYGGLSIAVGALHFVGAVRTVWLVPTLVVAIVLTLGLAAGRILSIAVDGFPGVFALGLLGSELALVAVASLALWRLNSAARAARKAATSA